MFKVIVERPRVGGYGEPKGRRKEHNKRNSFRAYENEEVYDEPSCWEKIRPVGRGADRKAFNENLEPLWRYLQTQVGRCWDDVYSDIRENLSPRNTVQMHVVQHLKWKVRENTYLGKDGRVYEHAEYAGRGAAPRCLEEPSRYKHEFYVHPVTREFCATPTKTNRQPDHGPVKFQVDLLVQYRLINGGWYVVDFEKIPKGLGVKNKYYTSGKLYQADLFNDPTDYRTVGDFLFPSGLENHQREQEYGYANIRAVSWRPLGKREIKKLQTLLKNS